MELYSRVQPQASLSQHWPAAHAQAVSLCHISRHKLTSKGLQQDRMKSWKAIAMSEQTAQLTSLCCLFTIYPNAALCKGAADSLFFSLDGYLLFFFSTVRALKERQ